MTKIGQGPALAALDYSNGVATGPTATIEAPMETKRDQPILMFDDADAWHAWLQSNHADASGVWLKIAKKGASDPTVTYAGALDVAIAYGWIDGQKAGYDESFWLQRFTRRSPRSKWSQVNREKAERLIAAGRMQPSGQAEMQRAKQDGRWEAAYPAQSQATVPDDFQRALDADPDARAFFETLTGSTRYAFLYRLHNVKREDARARRIADYIERLGQGHTLLDP
jgi:uncharacterized protein YdeI (YjbR/CyaY-like superfamily)